MNKENTCATRIFNGFLFTLGTRAENINTEKNIDLYSVLYYNILHRSKENIIK